MVIALIVLGLAAVAAANAISVLTSSRSAADWSEHVDDTFGSVV